MSSKFVDSCAAWVRRLRSGRGRRLDRSPAQWYQLIQQLHDLDPTERESWLAARVPDRNDRQDLLDAVEAGATTSLPRVAFSLPSSEDLSMPSRIGRYELRRVVGQGGWGIVYEAWDPDIDRAVALKVLSPERDTQENRRRFAYEWKTAGKFSHPNIVMVYHTGDHEGRPFVAMEYVAGKTLADIIRDEVAHRRSAPLVRKLAILEDICAGVAATHEENLAHRDIKPANIMVTEKGAGKVLDFGIAKSLDPIEALNAPVTGEHVIVGTIGYLAPERLTGAPVSTSSDIFAVAVVAYEFLTGRRPFGEIETQIGQRTFNGLVEPFSLLNGEVAKDVEEIVRKGMAVNASERFATISEMGEAFRKARLARSARHWRKPVPIALTIALTTLGALLATFGTRWLSRPPLPQRGPVSILVADFENRTGDPSFDGAFEQSLAIAMDGAPLVRVYERSDARQLASQVSGGRLDKEGAQGIARREDLTYVLAGVITNSGADITLQVDVVEPYSGAAQRTARVVARGKATVPAAFSDLAGRVRAALGDTAPLEHAETFTAATLQAAKEYGIAQDLAKQGNDKDAVVHYRAAIAADAQFGRAYSGLAVSAQRIGRIEDSEAASQKALELVGRMTERERYRTIGGYYLGNSHNYQKAVETYANLVEKYPSDSGGFANLALAHFYLRDFAKAIVEGRRAVQIDPKNAYQRSNLALYSMYAGDFGTAAAEARNVVKDSPHLETAYLPIVMDAIARDDLAAAASAYAEMAKIKEPGKDEIKQAAVSLASIGRADLAIYRGDLNSAADELARGIDQDRKENNSGGLALKLVTLAEVYAAKGIPNRGLTEVRDALSVWRRLLSVAVPAARVLAQAGQAADVRRLASELDTQTSSQYHAYSKIVLAELALATNKPNDAIRLLDDAIDKIDDLWLARFDRGVAYVKGGHFAEAVTEFDACEKRRGEATALFFDDVPTVRYLAPLRYWKARAFEGINSLDAARTHYISFIKLRTASAADPLTADARRRLAQLH